MKMASTRSRKLSHSRSKTSIWLIIVSALIISTLVGLANAQKIIPNPKLPPTLSSQLSSILNRAFLLFSPLPSVPPGVRQGEQIVTPVISSLFSAGSPSLSTNTRPHRSEWRKEGRNNNAPLGAVDRFKGGRNNNAPLGAVDRLMVDGSLSIQDKLMRIGDFADSRTDRLLEEIGFGPILTEGIAGWRGFSTYEKLEHAYHAAEQNHQGNGEIMGYLLIQALARDYPSIKSEPTFISFQHSYSHLSERKINFQLRSPSFSLKHYTIDMTTQAALERIADFIDDSMIGVLLLEISNETKSISENIKNIRIASKTNFQVLFNVFTFMAPESRLPAIRKMSMYLEARYPNTFPEFRSPHTNITQGPV